MSYIRSASNPEGLYIWSEGKFATIMRGPEIIGEIPTDIFNGLIRKYIQKNQYECSFKGASVAEVLVDLDGVKTYQTRLMYGNWSVDMWGVTWYYIAKSNYKAR